MARKNTRRKQSRRRKKRRERQGTSAAEQRAAALAQCCYPPVFVSADRSVVADPLALLGLSSDPTPEAVREAWREAMLSHPPEQHPEKAAALRKARDRLLDPERLIERELGVLHVPRPEAFGLPADVEDDDHLDALGRLMGQAMLYALVEEELWDAGLKEEYKRR